MDINKTTYDYQYNILFAITLLLDIYFVTIALIWILIILFSLYIIMNLWFLFLISKYYDESYAILFNSVSNNNIFQHNNNLYLYFILSVLFKIIRMILLLTLYPIYGSVIIILELIIYEQESIISTMETNSLLIYNNALNSFSKEYKKEEE